MFWKCETRLGTFWIKQVKGDKFVLGVGFEPLGAYDTPEDAAKDVYKCETGYMLWDEQTFVVRPSDLSDWITVKDN